MEISIYVKPIFWMEVLVAILLFIPFMDTPKRNFALTMSKTSFFLTLKNGMYVVSLFLAFALFSTWKETKKEGGGDAIVVLLARAQHDFFLCFSTLLFVPLVMRYFWVMSEMRRLEKSDIALKNQANQASKIAIALMGENEKLKQTNSELEKLSSENQGEPSSTLDLISDTSRSTKLLWHEKELLKQKNKDLTKELEQIKKDIEICKQSSIQQTERHVMARKSLQRVLEDYKQMALKRCPETSSSVVTNC